LHIAADGLAAVIDPETDERDLETVAEKAQGVQNYALLVLEANGDDARRTGSRYRII